MTDNTNYPNLIQNKQKLRAAIYIRVSTQDQAEMYGEDHQRSAILSYIESRKLNIELAGSTYVYRDTAVSWVTPIEDRPEFSRLIADLEYWSLAGKPFDIVIVYKIDRFARKLSLLLEIVDELSKYNVGFISTQEAIDTSNTFGKAMLGILWVFAELERDMILERTSGGYEEAQKNWVWMQDRYGYIRDDKTKRPININEKEAEIIKDIYERYVYGKQTITEITKYLQEKQIPIPAISTPGRGSKHKIRNPYFWRDSTVRDILQDELYIGKLYYNKSKTIKLENGKRKVTMLSKEEWILSEHRHTPIIDQDVFDEANRLLSNKKEYKRAKEDYLLSWLLWCDDCKEYRAKEMIKRTGTMSNGIRFYRCSGKDTGKFPEHTCRTIPLSEKALDTLVINTIKNIINRPKAIGKILSSRKYKQNIKEKNDKILQEVYNKESKILTGISNVKDMYAKGDSTKSEYEESIKKHNQDLKICREKIVTLEKNRRDYVEKEKYITTLEIAKNVLSDNIDDIFKDPKRTKLLLNQLVHSIIIYSRDKNDTDIIDGRKSKEPQRVPYQILIKLRLPQDILKDMAMGYTISPGETVKVEGYNPIGKSFSNYLQNNCSPQINTFASNVVRPTSKIYLELLVSIYRN